MTKILSDQTYKHRKGNFYKIICLANDRDTKKEMVVYQGQYNCPEYGDKPIWIRTKEDFLSTVEVDKKEVKKFELIE